MMTNKRLGDKMKYAAKVADFAVVIGEDEVKSGKFMMKNLTTGRLLSFRLQDEKTTSLVGEVVFLIYCASSKPYTGRGRLLYVIRAICRGRHRAYV